MERFFLVSPRVVVEVAVLVVSERRLLLPLAALVVTVLCISEILTHGAVMAQVGWEILQKAVSVVR
jgi:hypothetical protein